MGIKKDNEDLAKLAFGILNEDCGHCAEDHDKIEDAEETSNNPSEGEQILAEIALSADYNKVKTLMSKEVRIIIKETLWQRALDWYRGDPKTGNTDLSKAEHLLSLLVDTSRYGTGGGHPSVPYAGDSNMNVIFKSELWRAIKRWYKNAYSFKRSEDQEAPAPQVNPANPHGGPSVLSSDDKGQV